MNLEIGSGVNTLLVKLKRFQRKLRNIAFTYETERKEEGINAVPSQKSGFFLLALSADSDLPCDLN